MQEKIYSLLPFLAILVAWEIGSMVLNPIFLPSPERVVITLISMFQAHLMPMALIQSFLRITVATSIAAAVSIPIGLLVSNYPWADTLITPTISFMRYLPVTAFYPLLIMWVGIDESMKISFLFCATVFYFLPSVILAIKEVDVGIIEGARALGFSRLKTMYHIVLTAAAPSICESFLMMYGIGWTYIIIAEIVNTTNGLGHIINIASARGRTDMVFAALVVIILFSVIFDTTGRRWIRHKYCWKYLEPRREDSSSELLLRDH